MSKNIRVIKFAKGMTFRKVTVDMASYWGADEFWAYINACNDRW